jgi:hypothetical protein
MDRRSRAVFGLPCDVPVLGYSARLPQNSDDRTRDARVIGFTQRNARRQRAADQCPELGVTGKHMLAMSFSGDMHASGQRPRCYLSRSSYSFGPVVFLVYDLEDVATVPELRRSVGRWRTVIFLEEWQPWSQMRSSLHVP